MRGFVKALALTHPTLLTRAAAEPIRMSTVSMRRESVYPDSAEYVSLTMATDDLNLTVFDKRKNLGEGKRPSCRAAGMQIKEKPDDG